MLKKFVEIIKAGKKILLMYMVLAGILVLSALIELNQSREELLSIMRTQSHSLLDIVIRNSVIAIKSLDKLEEQITERLLNNAVFIKELQRNGEISNSKLKEIAEQNDIFRINIINSKGEKVFSNHKQIHFDQKARYSPLDVLRPLFTGETDTLYIGFKKARFVDETRFAVAINGIGKTAIVLNLNAEKILEFKKELGLGKLLNQVVNNRGVVYTALQNKNGIMAGAGKLNELEPLEDSPFLLNVLKTMDFSSRIFERGGTRVYETVHPYELDGAVIGVFRLGVSMEALDNINKRIISRLIVIGIILFVLGSFALSYIWVKQNYDLLERQYKSIETYSYKILKGVSDGIIVTDNNYKIKLHNKAAKKMFGSQIDEEKNLMEFIPKKYEEQVRRRKDFFGEIVLENHDDKKYLLCSKSCFKDEHGVSNFIFVLRDLTESKEIDAQKERQNRLVAMGELASGVAHEIRNPLNTIATIAQQLKMDFESVEDKEEYKRLTTLVYSEVKRINRTIESFLKFARPAPLKISTFNFNEFLNSIVEQYKSFLAQKKITIKFESEYPGEVSWDADKMRQVFSNLIQNAFEGTDDSGAIKIICTELNNNLKIVLEDNGKGMSEETLSKIFNLYFTTKSTGSGIGLSIVQRIISDHNGIISVESKPGKGTKFILKIPKFNKVIGEENE